MLKVVSSFRRHSEYRFVPLKNVSVQVNIHSFAAEVCIKQIFINSEETSNPIEAVYCFPIEEQAAIYSFTATLDDGRKIQAEIKEKKKAQREYSNALYKGHGAFLLEQDEKSHDIFTISIGSLKPQSKCEIEIHYVQELDLIDDGQRIQFILPTAIAPRYSSVSAGDGHIKSPASTTSKYVQSTPYTISFFCSISSLPIASVVSPSHAIQISSQQNAEQYPIMDVSLQQENTHLDRDIILNIELKQQQILTYSRVEKQAIMVSLVPTLELCSNSNQMGKVNCEYIFIVDGSGSMSEENKIGYARQAMSVFLKSLPVRSQFNIFRFGSTFEQFKKNEITIEYSEESAKEASNYINHMQADLGGTELYSVLSHLHEKPSQTNFSRQLFILTDGEIENVDEVLRLCHSMSNTTRIFSFGLGSSPSRALVKGLARVTNGSYLFIPPNTHVDVAIARQLDKALEPCLVNIKVQCHFDNNELKDYRISPKILPPIHARQRLNVYVMMPKNIEGTLSGSIEFLTEKDNLLERVTFNETQPLSSLIATRLAAKSIISDLQTDDYSSKSSRQARFIEDQQDKTKQELIDISIQHQILSPFTAFIGIETRTEEEIRDPAASSGDMILREIPIQIRAYVGKEDDDYSQWEYKQMVRLPINSPRVSYAEMNEDEEDDFIEAEIDEYSAPYLKNDRNCKSPSVQKQSHNRCRHVSRSRSRSPCHRRSSSSSAKDKQKNNSNPSDIVRQIIGLQMFSGLWSVKDLNKVILLLQQNITSTVSKDGHLKTIFDTYKDKDNDVILSMIIMFVFMKYFTDDQPLWKPIMKKSAKAMENRLDNKEYTEITDKIKQVV